MYGERFFFTFIYFFNEIQRTDRIRPAVSVTIFFTGYRYVGYPTARKMGYYDKRPKKKKEKIFSTGDEDVNIIIIL